MVIDKQTKHPITSPPNNTSGSGREEKADIHVIPEEAAALVRRIRRINWRRIGDSAR